jgi:hypothetical protein
MKAAEGKRPNGRPPKTEVDPDIVAAICENLEIGMPLDLAVEAVGVPRRSVYEWIEKFPDFSARLTRAKALGAKLLTLASLNGGKGSSNALWHLERRFREHYGPPRVEQSESEVKIVITGGLPPRPKVSPRTK